MNLVSPLEVRQLLTETGVRPNKSLGQNFLIDRNILNILIAAADLNAADHVLEIGGGLGVVTEELSANAGRVVVIEKDRRLAEHLTKMFSGRENVKIICDDAVEVLSKGKKGSARPEYSCDISGINKVVANLPYSVGTKVLVDMIRSAERPQTIVVTVQLEVAERFTAECGSSDYGLLSVWSHLHYDVELIKEISGTCFWPKPDVRSGILKFRANGRAEFSEENEKSLYALTKYAFGHRRKQMVNIMRHCPGELQMDPDKAALIFDSLGLALTLRPQNLTLSDWIRLVAAIREDIGDG